MLCQFVQQRFRFNSISRIKPLSEPVIDWSEQIVGVLALVLGLP